MPRVEAVYTYSPLDTGRAPKVATGPIAGRHWPGIPNELAADGRGYARVTRDDLGDVFY